MKKGVSSKTKTTIISSSSVLNYVVLHDWWLLKTKANRLAIGGFSTREKQGIRVFCSGPIAKRHDATTLETADGITITIVGFLNKPRTHQNGFPSEVCKHFLFGFPYHWEEFAVQCFGGESTKSDIPMKASGVEEFDPSSNNCVHNILPACLDELPVTSGRNLLMSSFGDSETLTDNVFSDILGRLSGLSNMKGNCPATMATELNRTPSNCKEADIEKFNDENSILDASEMRTEECEKNVCQSDGFMNDSTPRRGVSMDTELNRTPSNHKKAEIEKFKDGNEILNASDMRIEESEKNVCQSNRSLNDSTSRRSVSMDTKLNRRTPSNHKKAEVEKFKDGNQILNASDMRIEECEKNVCQSNRSMDDPTLRRGVSMDTKYNRRTPRNHKKAEVEKFKDGNQILNASDMRIEESEKNVCQSNRSMNDSTSRRGVSMDTRLNRRTPSNHKKAEVEQFKDGNQILNASDMRIEECEKNACQSNRSMDDPTSRRGVSMDAKLNRRTPRNHKEAEVEKCKDGNQILNAADMRIEESEKNVCQSNRSMNDSTSRRDVSVDTKLNRTPSKHKKAEVEKFKDGNHILNASDMRIEECEKNICQWNRSMKDSTSGRGVSMDTKYNRRTPRNHKKAEIGKFKDGNHILNASDMRIEDCEKNICQSNRSMNDSSSRRDVSMDTKLYMTPSSNHKKVEGEESKDENNILNPSDRRTEECGKNVCQSTGFMNDSIPRAGVSTNVMKKLKSLKHQLEWSLSSRASKKQKNF